MILILFLIILIFINFCNDDLSSIKVTIVDTNVTVVNSYKIWNINNMIDILSNIPNRHRSYLSLIFEWYLHNICYSFTDIFVRYSMNDNIFTNIHQRTKDVDLERF